MTIISEWAKGEHRSAHTFALPTITTFEIADFLTCIFAALYQNKRSKESVEIGMSYLNQLFSILSPVINSDLSKQMISNQIEGIKSIVDRYNSLLCEYSSIASESMPNWTAFYKSLVKYWRQLKTSNDYAKICEFSVEYQIFERVNNSHAAERSPQSSFFDLDSKAKEISENQQELRNNLRGKRTSTNKDKIVKFKKRSHNVSNQPEPEQLITSVKHSIKGLIANDNKLCK